MNSKTLRSLKPVVHDDFEFHRREQFCPECRNKTMHGFVIKDPSVYVKCAACKHERVFPRFSAHSAGTVDGSSSPNVEP